MARKGYVTLTMTLPNGDRKYFYGKTKEEAQEKLDNARMMLRAGIDIQNNITFGEYAQSWYTIYKKPDLREKSKESIVNALNNHILPYLSAVPLQEITPIAIKGCLNHLQDKSHSLYRTVLQVLRAIFLCAVDDRIIVVSPVPSSLKAKGKAAQEKVPLTREQEKILLNALSGTRAHLLVWLMDVTGVRRGEALGLMWDCVNVTDPKEATITIRRNLVYSKGKAVLEDTPKTDCGFRTIPIPSDLAETLIQKRRNTNSLFVFPMANGEMMSESSFRRLWEMIKARRVIEKTDVSENSPEKKSDEKSEEKREVNRHPWIDRCIDSDVTPHLLRHTFATRCFEDGMDIKEVQHLLGHASPNITMNIYLHYCEQQRQKETFDKVRESKKYLTTG